jgi:hypothetical protein
MQKIGISEKDFAKYQNELGMFLQEQMMNMMQPKTSTTSKKLTLDEVKKAVKMQTAYLGQNGQDLGQKLVNATNGWSQQEKMLLPSLLSVVIAD